MNRLLRTLCEGCFFKRLTNGCKLGKDTYFEEGRQFTGGFCNHKVTVEQARSASRDFVELAKTVDIDTSKLSIIILNLDNNLRNLLASVRSIKEANNRFVCQVILVCRQAGPSYMRKAFKMINALKVPWNINNLTPEPNEELDDILVSDFASQEVKCTWFTVLKAGERISQSHINQVYAQLSLGNVKNYMAFYVDEESINGLYVNTIAYNVMDGHVGGTWMNKVKEFDNWKKVCKQLN